MSYMNIKNLLGLGVPTTERITSQSLRQVDRSIKSEDTQERDANGQQFFDQQKKKNSKMSHEQFLKALGILNEKAFMKEMSWTAVELIDGEHFYAEVKDAQLNVIRKISEFDLWELFEDVRPGEEKKGQLLKKIA